MNWKPWLRRSARRQVTYSNVVATLALFLALGGGIAWAALGKNSVKSKQIAPKAVKASDLAKNAVTGAKIKNNTATGADVKESSLGKVPTAANADSVSGNTIAKVILIDRTTGTVSSRQILDLNGLILRGSCSNGLEQVVADTTVAGGEISSVGTDAAGAGTFSQGALDDAFNPGDNVALVNGATPNNDVYNVNYQGGDGRVVTVQFSTEGPTNGTCNIGGHAIG